MSVNAVINTNASNECCKFVFSSWISQRGVEHYDLQCDSTKIFPNMIDIATAKLISALLL